MKKSKELLISLLIMIVCLIIGLLIAYVSDDEDKTYTPKSEIIFEVCEKEVALENNVLIDKNTKAEIKINEKFENGFIPIALYEREFYYFIVYSNVQEELINNMYLLEHIDLNHNNLLYIISKETNKGVLISNKITNIENVRLDLSSIYFINEDTFVIDEYDFEYLERKDIYVYKIINDSDLFDVMETSWIKDSYDSNIILNSYLISNDYIIAECTRDDVTYLDISSIKIEFDYMTIYSNGKTLLSSYSANLNKMLMNNYLEKTYLFDGYYGLYEGEIIYLDNDLTVKKLGSSIIINTLQSQEEFEILYK